MSAVQIVRQTIVCLAICVSAGVLLTAADRSHDDPPRYDVSIQCADDSWVSDVPTGPNGNLVIDCDSSATLDCYVSSLPCKNRELFLFDLNGGDLEDGDIVAINTFNQFDGYFFTMGTGGGQPLVKEVGWAHLYPDDDNTFEIENLDCDDCSLAEGGRISLRNIAANKFWSAANGGGDVVNVNASTRGAWEQFELVVYAGPY